MPEACGSVMPGRSDHLLHRCILAPHDGPHAAPVTLDPGSRFAAVRVSWHDPLPPPYIPPEETP